MRNIFLKSLELSIFKMSVKSSFDSYTRPDIQVLYISVSFFLFLLCQLLRLFEISDCTWEFVHFFFQVCQFLKIFCLLEYSRFTMLCKFLLYSEVNQPYAYTYPLPSGFPSHLGHHRALSRVSHTIQQAFTSYLFHTQQCSWN